MVAQCSKLRVRPARTFPSSGALFSELCARCVHIFSMNYYGSILGECMENVSSARFYEPVHPDCTHNKNLISNTVAELGLLYHF